MVSALAPSSSSLKNYCLIILSPTTAFHLSVLLMQYYRKNQSIGHQPKTKPAMLLQDLGHDILYTLTCQNTCAEHFYTFIFQSCPLHPYKAQMSHLRSSFLNLFKIQLFIINLYVTFHPPHCFLLSHALLEGEASARQL